MPKPTYLTIEPATLDADGICEAQKPAAGGTQALTLDGALVSGGIAVFDYPRILSITSTGNESGLSFIVTGFDDIGNSGKVITETITGPNNTTVYSTKYFGKVTQITVSGNTAQNVTIGTHYRFRGPFLVLDQFAIDSRPTVTIFNNSVSIAVTTYVCYDDIFADAFNKSAPLTSMDYEEVIAEKVQDQSDHVQIPNRASALWQDIRGYVSGASFDMALFQGPNE